MPKHFYSKSAGGFYSDLIHDESQIPRDAVELTPAEYAAAFAGQAAGNNIVPGANGKPVLAPRPDFSPEIKLADMRLQRDALLVETDKVVNRHRDEVERGLPTTLTETEYQATQDYRQELRDLPQGVIDATKAVWPDKPEVAVKAIR